MKKFFVGIMALMLSAMTVWAERVSESDAALVANNFMNVAAANTGAKKAPAKRMVLKQAPAAQANQYYIYENANGEGWVLVAANDVAHPILAYSETGHFRTDNQPANLKVWLNGYNRQITRAEQDDNYVANEEVQNEWRTLRKGVSPKKATPVVSPLIKTGWDQGSPYWNLCPQKSSSRCYTGCVATAMAQVMNYHQWPKKGTGSHTIPGTSRTADFGNTTYDWDNMLDTYGSSATNAQKNAVATLMYHCGVAVDMQYGTASEGGSGAYTIDFNGYWSGEGKMCAEKALTQFFGYKSSTVTGYYRDGSAEDGMRSWTKPEWIAMLKEELDAQRPIMYAGAGYEDPNDEETGYGHSFVCDGYDSSDKFHFNWGWSNSCDGYYDVDALEPSEPGSGGGNGEYNLEQDVIVGIIPDKKDLPMVTVTWSVDGNETTSQIMQTDPLVLPADPADCDGEGGKKFVGWTAQSEVDGEAPSDLFTTAGDKTVTEPVTYYAVFATAEEGGGEEITKASSIAVGDKVILVYETGKMELTSFSTGSTVYGIGSSYSGTPNGAYIFNVVAGSTTGSFAFENGGKYWNWSSGNSLSTATSISANSSWTVSFSSGDAYIVNVSDGSRSIQWNTSSPRFACYTSSQAAVQLYKKATGTSYSNYSLSCGATVVCELSSIELNTADVKKSFKQNEAFTYSGLVVTAHFNNCSDKTVAPTSVSAPDMSTAGNKTITVSYTKGETTKTATYDITVTELPTYTIRFFNNGTQVGADQHVTEGQEATPPADPTAACDDYTFVGWWTAELAADNKTAQSWVSDFTATKDQDYYAIYSKTETEEGGASASVTFKTASSDSNTDESSTAGAIRTHLVDTESGISSYSGSKVYAGENGAKLGSSKAAGSITLTLTQPITTKEVKVLAYQYGSDTGTLSVEANGATTIGAAQQPNGTTMSFTATSDIEISTLTVSTSSKRAYIKSIVIGGGASSTTYYSSVVSCTGTDIENTVIDCEKAVKVIENGQIVIIRGKEKYTIFGQKIQ